MGWPVLNRAAFASPKVTAPFKLVTPETVRLVAAKAALKVPEVPVRVMSGFVVPSAVTSPLKTIESASDPIAIQ